MTAATFSEALGLFFAPSRATILEGTERLGRQVLAGLRFAAEAERRYHAIRRLHALDDQILAAHGLSREEIVPAIYWLEFAD